MTVRLAYRIIHLVLVWHVHQLVLVQQLLKSILLFQDRRRCDSIFSMEPSEFNLLVSETKKAWESQGEIFFVEQNLKRIQDKEGGHYIFSKYKERICTK